MIELRRSYLLDSNILVHSANPASDKHVFVQQCLDVLWMRGADLVYTSQNLAEFWNVCTRPVEKNGLGLSVAETDKRASVIEGQLGLLEDSFAVHHVWRALLVETGVSGAQVHDARLAAAMQVHAVGAVLTYNLRDFRRFP